MPINNIHDSSFAERRMSTSASFKSLEWRKDFENLEKTVEPIENETVVIHNLPVVDVPQQLHPECDRSTSSGKHVEDSSRIQYKDYDSSGLCPVLRIVPSLALSIDRASPDDVEALAVLDSENTGEVEEGDCVQCEAHALIPGIPHDWKLGMDTFGKQELMGYTRPLFIFCQVNKPSPDYPIGIYFKNERQNGQKRKNIVRISKIDWDSPFAKPNAFQPGDQILSINNVSTTGMNADQIDEFVRHLPDSVSITVKNEGGDPNVVLNCVEKTHESEKVGISVKNDKKRSYVLLVSKIQDSSPLASSLMMPGHQCLMINGISCPNLLARDAVRLIHSSDPSSDANFITILSKPYRKNYNQATVISCEPRQSKKHISILYQPLLKKLRTKAHRPKAVA